MNQSSDPIARAFEVAKSGTCYSIDDIARILTREGFTNVIAHLSGPTLKRQLYGLMKSTQTPAADHGH